MPLAEPRALLVDEPGVDAARGNVFVAYEILQEADIGLYPLDAEFAQGAVGAAQQVVHPSGGHVDHELRKQRVETVGGV